MPLYHSDILCRILHIMLAKGPIRGMVQSSCGSRIEGSVGSIDYQMRDVVRSLGSGGLGAWVLSEEAQMNFEDNFVQPIEGHLIDPALKIRLGTSAPREAYDFTEAVVSIWYDSEISEEKLTQPLSADLQAVYLATPGYEHKADELRIFSSGRSVRIGWINVELDFCEGILAVRVLGDPRTLRLKAEEIGNAGVPVVSEHPEAFLLYVMRSIAKLSKLRDERLTDRFAGLQQIQILAPVNVATQVLCVSGHGLHEAQSSWVELAQAELSQ